MVFARKSAGEELEGIHGFRVLRAKFLEVYLLDVGCGDAVMVMSLEVVGGGVDVMHVSAYR